MRCDGCASLCPEHGYVQAVNAGQLNGLVLIYVLEHLKCRLIHTSTFSMSKCFLCNIHAHSHSEKITGSSSGFSVLPRNTLPHKHEQMFGCFCVVRSDWVIVEKN